MNAQGIAKERFYPAKSIIPHGNCQGWHFSTLREGRGGEEAT